MKITPVGADTTFGELDDKETGPNHWKRNNFTWNLLQKCAVWNKALEYHSHLVQHCFCPILEQSNPSKKSITQHGLRQTSMKFHVPSLNKCQLVSLIFDNTEWQSWDGKKLFQFPLLEKMCFPNTVLLFHSKNIGIGNWQLWSSIKSNS